MIFDGPRFFQDFSIPTDARDAHRGWLHINCPFCGDRKFKGGFNLQLGSFQCFKCGKHKVIDMIMRVIKVPYSEAAHYFRLYMGASGGFVERRKAEAKKVDLPEPFFTLPRERDYLRKRGLWDPEILHRADLRSGGISGKWAYRIVVPITLNGHIVAATGRDWTGKQEIPYLTTSNKESVVDPKTIFLGLDWVPARTAAVVEGPFDAIKAGPGFIASFGAALTPEQLYLLSAYSKVFFVLDNDKAGRDANVKFALFLDALGVDVEIIKWKLSAKDTGEFSKQSIGDLREFIGFQRDWARVA